MEYKINGIYSTKFKGSQVTVKLLGFNKDDYAILELPNGSKINRSKSKFDQASTDEVVAHQVAAVNNTQNSFSVDPELIQQNKRLAEKLDSFDINKRFKFLEALVDMTIKGRRKALLITGKGGLGKTHTVRERLESEKNQKWLTKYFENEAGEDQVDEITPGVKWVKGYTTAKGLYNTLYYNSDRLVIFDDCDEALKNDTAKNILKGALDSYDERIISWNSQQSPSSDIPTEFEFTGRVIFISNLPQTKMDNAVLTRCSKIDLGMTNDQKIERMEEVIKSSKFKKGVSYEDKKECLELIKNNAELISNINFRTLQEVIDYQQESKENGDELWKELAEYATITAVA